MSIEKLNIFVSLTLSVAYLHRDKPKQAEFYPVATSQEELPARSMAHSHRTAIIPLGSNPTLKEKYLALYGGIRFGRILEDLDTFAGKVNIKQTSFTTEPALLTKHL